VHHEDNKILAYCKGEHLFVFNFHPVGDCTVTIPARAVEKYETVLHTSWTTFGGYRDNMPQEFHVDSRSGRAQLEIRMDKRSALVCRPKGK